MGESAPGQSINKSNEREQRIKRIVALALELRAKPEGFPFPGMDPFAHSRMKTEQEEYPGYSTPVDELIERFNNEGMKVVLGAHPESGNVFILPSGSNDIENDNLLPRHLQIGETMDERLKELILMSRAGVK